MPSAEAEKTRIRAHLTPAQFRQIVERAAYQLQLAHDAARAFDVPFQRLQRYKRAQREMNDELREMKQEK